jgi:hypothetical protein
MAAQPAVNRAVALLHSFAFKSAAESFNHAIARKYDAQTLKSCERADRPGRRALIEAARAISGPP